MNSGKPSKTMRWPACRRILFNAQGKGEKKLEWVSKYIEAQCAAHGIKIDMDTVRIAIENAWKDLGLDHSTEQEKVV